MTTTIDSFSSIEINWLTPKDISAIGPTTWNRIRVYKSGDENTGYNLIEAYDPTTAKVITFSGDPVNMVNLTAHGYTDGSLVAFYSTSTLPSNLVAGTVYYVVNATANTFQVSKSLGTAPVVFTDLGSGVQSVYTGTVKSEIVSQVAGVWVTRWSDPTSVLASKDSIYYLVRYYDTSHDLESKFYLTFKTLSPKEQRLVNMIRSWVTPWMSTCLTDDDIRAGIVLAMNAINIYPPTTSFSLNSFPTNMESLLIPGAAIFTLMFKYLGVAFTDISYNDNGLSLAIDRGAKVKTAIDTTMGYYNQLLAISKMEYAYGGSGVGTIQLPISIGGNLNKGILNVFDIFSSLGR